MTQPPQADPTPGAGDIQPPEPPKEQQVPPTQPTPASPAATPAGEAGWAAPLPQQPQQQPGVQQQSGIPHPGQQQHWAWAQPQQQMVQTETEPLEYHRLYRGAPRFAWWKPLVALVLAASIYFAMSIAFSLALAPVLYVLDPGYVNDALLQGIAPVLDTQHPLSLVLGMGSIILMIPAVLLAMLALGIRPTGRVWSVAGRIRWGLLGRTLGAAVLGVIVMNGVGILVGRAMEASAGVTVSEPLAFERDDFNVSAALISFGLVLLLVPFQAAAEEVVFRGMLLQVLGSWMKSPWFAIGLSSLLFATMHIYDIWGMLAVGLMGLVAAWLTWKTGGLEAAIAIHIVNNIVAFGFMTAGMGGDTGQVESSGGFESVIGEVAGLAVFAWLVMRIFAKHGYGRERVDLVWKPAQFQLDHRVAQ